MGGWEPNVAQRVNYAIDHAPRDRRSTHASKEFHLFSRESIFEASSYLHRWLEMHMEHTSLLKGRSGAGQCRGRRPRSIWHRNETNQRETAPTRNTRTRSCTLTALALHIVVACGVRQVVDRVVLALQWRARRAWRGVSADGVVDFGTSLGCSMQRTSLKVSICAR